jgi:hypothetical protein
MCLYNPHLKFQITNRVLLILQIDICLKSADCVPDPDCPTNNDEEKNRKKIFKSSRFSFSRLQKLESVTYKKKAKTQPSQDDIISPKLSIDDSQCTNNGGTPKINSGIQFCENFQIKKSSARKCTGYLHILILQFHFIFLFINTL